MCDSFWPRPAGVQQINRALAMRANARWLQSAATHICRERPAAASPRWICARVRPRPNQTETDLQMQRMMCENKYGVLRSCSRIFLQNNIVDNSLKLNQNVLLCFAGKTMNEDEKNCRLTPKGDFGGQISHPRPDFDSGMNVPRTPRSQRIRPRRTARKSAVCAALRARHANRR